LFQIILSVINLLYLVFGLDAVSEIVECKNHEAGVRFTYDLVLLVLHSAVSFDSSYLVDPASSHMLVSKIKPCMSKYKHLYTVKLRTAHYISYYLFDGTLLHGYP
jgi:hypothetical protein